MNSVHRTRAAPRRRAAGAVLGCRGKPRYARTEIVAPKSLDTSAPLPMSIKPWGATQTRGIGRGGRPGRERGRDECAGDTHGRHSGSSSSAPDRFQCGTPASVVPCGAASPRASEVRRTGPRVRSGVDSPRSARPPSVAGSPRAPTRRTSAPAFGSLCNFERTQHVLARKVSSSTIDGIRPVRNGNEYTPRAPCRSSTKAVRWEEAPGAWHERKSFLKQAATAAREDNDELLD
jgi:hypothetical protein